MTRTDRLDEVGFDQEIYDNMIKFARENGIHIVHTFYKYFPFGGYTFTWQRTTINRKCKMIRVSVSFCSPKDQFDKKIGSWNALCNLQEDNAILLPVGSGNNEDIVCTLRHMFDLSMPGPTYDQ
jgi:hypothetical protein